MLRVAGSRVPPLSLRLREGPIISRPGPTYYAGLVNDTTQVLRSYYGQHPDSRFFITKLPLVFFNDSILLQQEGSGSKISLTREAIS